MKFATLDSCRAGCGMKTFSHRLSCFADPNRREVLLGVRARQLPQLRLRDAAVGEDPRGAQVLLGGRGHQVPAADHVGVTD